MIRPDLITLVREARALTQSAFADAAGLTQARVSRIEAGLVQVSDDDLRRIADALKAPSEFFKQGERVHSGGACFKYRKQKSVGLKLVRMIEARSGFLSLAIARLLQGVEFEQERNFGRLDLGEDGDVGSPEEAAQWLRRDWGVRSGPIPNMTKLLEDAGAIILICDFGTPRVDALSQWNPPLPPMHFVSTSIPGDRLRWTLAHEAAHVLLHHRPTKDPEREADAFAAEFLMPEKDIRSQLRGVTLSKLASLKIEWRVSMAALARRAFSLGEISREHYTNLNIEISRNGWKKKEPNPLPVERPTLLAEVIEYHRSELGYGNEELRRKLLLSPDDYGRLLADAEPDRPKLRVV